MWKCTDGLCLLAMCEQVNQMPVVAGTDLVLTIKASPSVDVTGGLIKTETKVRLTSADQSNRFRARLAMWE